MRTSAKNQLLQKCLFLFLIGCAYSLSVPDSLESLEKSNFHVASGVVNIYNCADDSFNVSSAFKNIMKELRDIKEQLKECSCKQEKPKDVVASKPEDFLQSRCAGSTSPAVVSPGVLSLDGSQPGRFPQNGFCMNQARKSLNTTNYTISVDLYNVNSMHGYNNGHPGVSYNLQDDANYDFVYIRPHSTSACYQTGKVDNSVITYQGSETQTGRCAGGQPRGRKWFNVKISVTDRKAKVYKDGQLTATVTTRFPATASGGVILANGFENVVNFRNFKIVDNNA